MASHSQRKKAERAQREAKPPPVRPVGAERVDCLNEGKLLESASAFICGLVMLVSGSSDEATVLEVMKQCLRKGAEVTGCLGNRQNLAWPKLFLTLACAEKTAVPHAGPRHYPP